MVPPLTMVACSASYITGVAKAGSALTTIRMPAANTATTPAAALRRMGRVTFTPFVVRTRRTVSPIKIGRAQGRGMPYVGTGKAAACPAALHELRLAGRVFVAMQSPAYGEQLDLGTGSDQPLTGVEHLAHVRRLRANHGHADLRPAVPVERADLGHGNLELAYRGDDRAPVRTLGLQRARVTRQQQVEQGGSGVHAVRASPPASAGPRLAGRPTRAAAPLRRPAPDRAGGAAALRRCRRGRSRRTGRRPGQAPRPGRPARRAGGGTAPTPRRR